MQAQSRRLAAAFTIVIFILSTFAIIAPANAHFTLGNLSGTSPYEIRNFDPHVAGPIGYVWPGSGENAYSGFPNIASDNLSPGYQPPYPAGNPPGAPDNSWYQLQGDTYSPFGAVLTGSTGDLIFALNATGTPSTWVNNPSAGFTCTETGVTSPKCELQTPLSNTKGWDTWMILIPPEFEVPDSSQVVSTLTNNYAGIIVSKISPDDRYAPNWTLVAITVDGAVDAGCAPGAQAAACGAKTPTQIYYDHQFINFTSDGEWYYARINGVTAPSTAGRYFFKMFLYSTFQTKPLRIGANIYGVGPTLGGPGVTTTTALNQLGENPDVWIPPQNWPVMLVKGEVDPAIITGTLRYAGYNATLYQQPIAEAAFVNATMTERINPYTGSPDPTLPLINGQAFVNATANGHYELEGLAPGIYDIYASAAGFPTQLCVSGITVLRGQSLHFDCYLQPGPVIHGNAFTKHQFGDEPWPGNSTTGQYIKIELYANPTLSNLVDPSAGPPVSWTPLPCTAGGQEMYYGGRAAGLCGDPRDGSAIAFPWHEYSTVNGALYNDPASLFTGATNGYSRDVAIGPSGTFPTGTANSPLGVDNLLSSDPEGVGPPQHWFVQGGTTTPFHFEMGVKGEYGAPTWLSGEVPQVYATWVNGLTPGRYYVRAWTFRYVQTALDGSTFQEYYFDITPNEWAGDVTLPIDLRLSSWVNKTVYFHDTLNTIETNPIHSGAGYLWGQLIGSDGHVYAANVTGLGLLENSTATATCASLMTLGLRGCEGLPFEVGVPPIGPYHYGLTPGTTLQTGVTPSEVTPYYYYSPDTTYSACQTYDQYANAFASANGNFFQTGEIGAPSQACPFPSGKGDEVSALDKAGLNANSIATGKATIQFWGINDTWGGENYGIPSGTYSPNVYVNGYAPLSSPEQVSVTLSGNPTSVSDHMILAPGFNVSVYSIDWEQPTVARNWVWSGCQDAGGTSANGEPCLGSELDLGFYQVTNGVAGTYSDYFGTEPSILPSSISARNNFGGLYQGPGGVDCISGELDAISCMQMDGGGRDVLPGYANAHDAYYGQSARYAFVGGVTPAAFGFLRATQLIQDSMWTTLVTTQPLHFSQGEYDLGAYTYGYIQDQPYTAYAMNGQVADMRLNLIIGVNVTLDILFKKESIITPTPFNMSARVRLFNDQGQLVATWMSSEGTYVDRSGHAIGANGQLPTPTPAVSNPFDANGGQVADSVYPLYPFMDGGGSPWTGVSSDLNGYNFVPGGTTLLHVVMAGLPQQVPEGSNIVGVYFGDPVFTPASCDFELDCYVNTYLNYAFPYTGIAGAPDYTGGWTAEVDFVPWYNNNTGTTPNYYPPVNGLLMGESYHIIPGTTATTGISLTEDAAQGATFLGHSLAVNHLGPYSQEGVWQIAGTHNSGEASAIFEVDLNGFISGQVLGFTWANEFRTQSWDAISVTGASGATLPSMYTFDGIYQGFFSPGSYSFAINAPGYAPQTWSISITPGESGTGQNIYLQQSKIPVPEFSDIAIAAFSALAASVYLLKQRRKQASEHPKRRVVSHNYFAS